MLPVKQGSKQGWRIVVVKSATSIKNYHRDDAAIQAYACRAAGVPLIEIALAYIDKTWVYPGDEDYRGLLIEHALTEETFARGEEVEGWIACAQAIAREQVEPAIPTGSQCNEPYSCGFIDHCLSQVAAPEHPASWFPRIQSKALIEHLARGSDDMRDVPDELLNEKQLRVKRCTLNNEVYFDPQGAATDLVPYPLPGYFLDFETVQFAVPIWKGTRPYQQLPFQFSMHYLLPTGELEHREFLDLSGNDPSKAFAEALIEACGQQGPVFVYNAAFETTRIKELAARFSEIEAPLFAIKERIVDLLRVAEARYYHPCQQGSWSIKKLLPAIAPEMRHDQLDGVQDGGMAMEAFKEAISGSCAPERKVEVERQLRNYCRLDTLAMVRVWHHFTNQLTTDELHSRHADTLTANCWDQTLIDPLL